MNTPLHNLNAWEVKIGRPHRKGKSKGARTLKCLYCLKMYVMNWALENHKKVCPYTNLDTPKSF